MAELHVVIRMDSLLVLKDEVTTNSFLAFFNDGDGDREFPVVVE